MLIGKKDELEVPKETQYSFFIFIFAIAVFLLPIDWIKGISIFGEFSIMSSFYVFFMLVIMSFPFLLFNKNKIAPELIWFIGLITFAVVVGFVINVENILLSSLKGRSGIHKFSTTIITLYFGIALMYITAKLSQNELFIKKVILKPVVLSMILVLTVSFIEILGWYSGFMHGLYLKLSSFFRSGYPVSSVIDGRIRGVSGEPASMAIFLGFAIIWIGLVLKTPYLNKKILTKTFMYSLLIGGLILFFLTKARTGYVILLGLALMKLAIPIILKFPAGNNYKPFSINMVLMFSIVFTVIAYLSQSEAISRYVIEGDSWSNLSRYASNYTAFSIFIENPLFGKGAGQYAFNAKNYMPEWGWESWEIRNWFTDPTKIWPPVFSLPARLASELGVVGVAAWYIPILQLFSRLLYVVRKEKQRLNRVPALGTSLILAMVYALLQGIAQESFRFFEFWIILGIVSSYTMTNNPETRFFNVQHEGSLRETLTLNIVKS